jgi:hypothetical protein
VLTLFHTDGFGVESEHPKDGNSDTFKFGAW